MGIYVELINKNDRDRNVFEVEADIARDLQFLGSEGFEFEIQAEE